MSHHKKGLVEWLKVYALSSNQVPKEKKIKKNPQLSWAWWQHTCNSNTQET
jgi:hypothetical protein